MALQKDWRPEAVTLLMGSIILSFLGGGTLIAVLHHFGVAGFKGEDGVGTILTATLCFHGVVLAGSLPFLKYHETNWRAVLGLDNSGLGGALGLAAMAFPVIVIVVMGLQYTCIKILTHFHYPAADQEAVDMILNAKSHALRIYLIIFAVGIAPVAEEFIFRGILFPFVKQLGYPRLAWLAPSLLFALIHASLPIFVPLFVFALGLTWLYATTGRLLTNILVHGLFNALNLILLLNSNS